MEFTRPEDAAIAASHPDHFILGKKASIQFFKTKDSQRKGQQETEERSKGFNTQQNIQRKGAQASEYYSRNPKLGDAFARVHANYSIPQQVSSSNQDYQHSSFFYENYPANLQRNSMVQPASWKPTSEAKPFKDFYRSLKRADYIRKLAANHHESNLCLRREREWRF